MLKTQGENDQRMIRLSMDIAREDEVLRLSPSKYPALERLYVRRWLVVIAAAILFFFHLRFALPASAVVIGTGVIAAAAALLPREGLIRVTRSPFEGPDAAAYLQDAAARIIGGLPDPALLLGADGEVLSLNARALESFEGAKPGRHIAAVIRHPQVLNAVEKVAASRSESQTVSYSEMVPVERHVSATVSWIGGTRRSAVPGEPALIVVLRDLTERQRLDQMRADFIADASHELKTPLASLIGFIETLLGPARADEAARERFLLIMLRQAQRMSRLIENLLSLSRVEMKAHLRPQTPVPIAEVVQHAAQSLEPVAAEAGVSLRIERIDDPHVMALGDRDELIQLFQNLIHNAVKYGRPGGRVSLSLSRLPGGGRIAVEVEDDGPGIDAQHLPRLTERFYRVGDKNLGEKAGAGLGLAIAQQVVSRHRGELRISSTLGRGSTFTVILTECANAAGQAVEAL